MKRYVPYASTAAQPADSAHFASAQLFDRVATCVAVVVILIFTGSISTASAAVNWSYSFVNPTYNLSPTQEVYVPVTLTNSASSTGSLSFGQDITGYEGDLTPPYSLLGFGKDVPFPWTSFTDQLKTPIPPGQSRTFIFATLTPQVPVPAGTYSVPPIEGFLGISAFVPATNTFSWTVGPPTPLPAAPSVTTSPNNFLFPLTATTPPPTGRSAYQLITQAGGLSSDGSHDLAHENGGYYSVDFKANETANVVAGKAGVVVRSVASYQQSLSNCNTLPCDPGPVIVIYNGNGIYSEYREFTANSNTVKVGDYVQAGQTIGQFVPGQTNPYVDPGSTTALHFQVKYTPGFTSPCSSQAQCVPLAGDAVKFFGAGTGLSAQNVTQLQNVTLDGKGLTSPVYEFDLGANGLPTSKPVFPANTASGLAAISTLPLSGFKAQDAYVANAMALMIEQSPAYLWNDVTVPGSAQFMSFNYFWTNKGDGDYLTVSFNDDILFSSLGTDFSDPDFVNSGLIDVSKYDGENGQLLFALNSVGDKNAELDLRDLTFFSALSAISAVPEPSTWAMYILGFGAVGVILRARRRRRDPALSNYDFFW